MAMVPEERTENAVPVAGAGFGNGVAIPPPGGNGGTGNRGTVQAGGAPAAAVGVDAPKPKETEAVAAVQPVEILAKPNPQYTDEARKLGLEGEVLVQVVFPASGPVQVVRVIKGLGHGLDESAMHAGRTDSIQAGTTKRQTGGFPRDRAHRLSNRILSFI